MTGIRSSTDRSVPVLLRDSPFVAPGDYRTVSVRAGQSIQTIVAATLSPWQVAFARVILNDTVIIRADWPLTVPGAHDTLTILLIPQGGEVGSIFKAVAVIAVTLVATYFAGPAGLELGASLAAGVGAAAGLATSLAFNALFPPPTPLQPGLGSSGVTQDPVYGFNQVSNSSTPYGVIPRIYGRRKIMPLHAMNPSVVNSGNSQYLIQCFTAGYGPLLVESIQIGDTPIENYSDVTCVVHEAFAAGDTLQLCQDDVWTDPYSVNLTHGLVSVNNTTDHAERASVDLQFANGLYRINKSNGNTEGVAITLGIDVAAVGSDDWQPASNFSATVAGLGSSLNGAQLTVRGMMSQPFFVSVGLTFPKAGQYQIRIVRKTDDQNPALTAIYSICYLASIKSYRSVAPIVPDQPICLIELKIRATDQLNGSVNNLSCIVTSKLPVYDGSTWTICPTRNPAWCYLDILRGSAIARPVSDGRIDFAGFIDWAHWCDAAMANAPDLPRAQCDLEITAQTTVWETLKLVAATGYATPSTAAGKHSIAIDRPQATPVQMFTPRNIKGLSGEIAYNLQPHALRVQYTPTDSTTATEEVVFDDGYSADGSDGTALATVYEVLKLVGISRREQAYVLGRRSLAQGRLRIETFKIACDAENLLVTRGSFVRLAHDVPKLGSGWGRVVAVDGRMLSLDAEITVADASKDLYVRIRKTDGQQFDRTVMAYAGSALTLTADAPIAIGDLVAYGNLDRVTMDCLVKAIRPSGDLEATLELVPYAPAIYSAEVAAIPPYDPAIAGWSGGTPEGGSTGVTGLSGAPGLVTALQGSVFVNYVEHRPQVSVVLSWQAPVTGNPAIQYRVYHDWNGAWQLRATVYNTAAVAYTDQTLLDTAGVPVRMDGVSLRFAVVGIDAQGAALTPASAAQVFVTPQARPPANVESLIVTGGIFCNTLQWTLQTNGFDVADVRVFGALVNDRAQASLLAAVAADQSGWQHNGLSPGVVWYYWILLVDAACNTSDWYPSNAKRGIGAAASKDAAAVLAVLDKSIGLQQLADEIAQPIQAAVDVQNSLDWIDQQNLILKLALEAFKDHAAVQASAQVASENIQRVTSDEALAQQITTIGASVDHAVAAITEEATARAQGDNAHAQTITALQARLDTGDYAAIKQQMRVTASAVDGIQAKYLLQVDANGHVAAIALQSDTQLSSMVFLADKFMLANPDGSSARPLLEIGTVNGVEVLGFKGTLIGADGLFSGNLSAAGGSFSGSLNAATGTFGGTLLAGVLDMTKLQGYAETRSSPGVYDFTITADYPELRYQLLGGGGGGGVGNYGEWNTPAGAGGGGGAGQYLIGTTGAFPAGTIVRLVVGAAGTAGLEWLQNGGNGSPTYLQYKLPSQSTFTTFVSADYGRGGICAPEIYYDNADGAVVNGAGGFGYPAGHDGSVDGYATGGNGAASLWGSGGVGVAQGYGGSATGYGAGGAGGGLHAGWRFNSWHNSGKYNGWYPGGAGTAGRAIVEFFNPNAVVLRTDFNSLSTRVTLIEQRLANAGV